jgi:hypothetical protein
LQNGNWIDFIDKFIVLYRIVVIGYIAVAANDIVLIVIVIHVVLAMKKHRMNRLVFHVCGVFDVAA